MLNHVVSVLPGNQLKGEFTKSSVAVELPNGHQLRNALDTAKEELENLMDEFLVPIQKQSHKSYILL